MRYYLGPWLWNAQAEPCHWGPPAGASCGIDLAPDSAFRKPGQDRPVGFFPSTQRLGSDYAELGQGDMRSIASSLRVRQAFEAATGYRPSGNTLAELLADVLTNGADPHGDRCCKPLVPTVDGRLELWVLGHGPAPVWSVGHRWGMCSVGAAYDARLQALMHQQFRQLQREAEAGLFRDPVQHRRILDFEAIKYGLAGDGWKLLVPRDVWTAIVGRAEHHTSISDDFDTADSSTVGHLLTWTELAGDKWENRSNTARLKGDSAVVSDRFIRAESDLSSVDHYSQFTLANFSETSGNQCQAAAVCRFASAATTGYLGLINGIAIHGFQGWFIFKSVAGTLTSLSSGTYGSIPTTLKAQASGSSIDMWTGATERGPITDTSITTGTRCGMYGLVGNFAGGGDVVVIDDFLAADLAAASVIPVFGHHYTQQVMQ